jgi:hypothetical protein
MPNDANSRAIQLSFQKLSDAAESLNQATNEIRSAIAELDEMLAGLHLGIEGWVTFNSDNDPDQPWYRTDYEIGYAKIGGTWGTAIRAVARDLQEDEETPGDPWKFNDAPRDMRLQAVHHIPALIETLTKETSRIAQRASQSARTAKDLSISLSWQDADGTKGERK